jgi:hypothetical protein
MKLIRNVATTLLAAWMILQFVGAAALIHNTNHQNYTIPKIAKIAYALNPCKYL